MSRKHLILLRLSKKWARKHFSGPRGCLLLVNWCTVAPAVFFSAFFGTPYTFVFHMAQSLMSSQNTWCYLFWISGLTCWTWQRQRSSEGLHSRCQNRRGSRMGTCNNQETLLQALITCNGSRVPLPHFVLLVYQLPIFGRLVPREKRLRPRRPELTQFWSDSIANSLFVDVLVELD